MNPYRRSVYPHLQVRRRRRQGGRWQNYSSDARCLAIVEDFDSILLREVIRGSDSTQCPCVMGHLYVSRPYNHSQALPHGWRKVKTMRMIESTSLPFNVTAFGVSPPCVLIFNHAAFPSHIHIVPFCVVAHFLIVLSGYFWWRPTRL
jgi:hypothetical protein